MISQVAKRSIFKIGVAKAILILFERRDTVIDTEGFGIKRMRQKQFLVHSFLYYKLDESIINDTDYDILCKNMIKSMERNKQDTGYDALCEPCGTTGSGFYIKEYPPEIITSAFRVLYFHKKKYYGYTGTLSDLISKWNYQIIGRS